MVDTSKENFQSKKDKLNISNSDSMVESNDHPNLFQSDMMILIEDTQSYWWNQIDFNCGFLLSNLKHFSKSQSSMYIHQIVTESKIPIEIAQPLKYHLKKSGTSLSDAWTLIGVRNHFLCPWIFLIHDINSFKSEDLFNTIKALNIQSAEVFGDFSFNQKLHSRLKSLLLIPDLMP